MVVLLLLSACLLFYDDVHFLLVLALAVCGKFFRFFENPVSDMAPGPLKLCRSKMTLKSRVKAIEAPDQDLNLII